MIGPVKMHVLLVDDEEDVGTIFRMKFKKWIRKGLIRLTFSTSAKDALSELSKDHCDIILVLSDINMPEMDGISMLDIIKKKFDYVEVYMISAYSSPDYKDKSFEKGATHYFEKPIDFCALKRSICHDFPELECCKEDLM